MPESRAIKDTMALIAHSIGGTKLACTQMSGHPWHPADNDDPALLNWEGVRRHPTMDNLNELCHREWFLIVWLHADYVLPFESLLIGALSAL